MQVADGLGIATKALKGACAFDEPRGFPASVRQFEVDQRQGGMKLRRVDEGVNPVGFEHDTVVELVAGFEV